MATASELVVKVQRIHAIKKHPNADKLEVAVIGAEGGWETCVKVGFFHPEQLVIYIPPDTLVPKALHEFLNITNYCGELPASSQEAVDGYRRVKAARLRGQKSFGVLMTMQDLRQYLTITKPDNVDDVNTVLECLGEDSNVVDLLGVKKWIPKEKVLCGEAAKPISWFHEYTNIQNIKNNPNLFKNGECVVITEKIHGTNCRIGLVKQEAELLDGPDGGTSISVLEWAAGSHTVQRKELDSEGRKSKYWTPLDNNQMRAMITELAEANPGCHSVVVFGEIYGSGIQDMTYGLVGSTDFRVFDIAINGNYMDWVDVVSVCTYWKIATVPELYRGPFSNEIVDKLTDGPTTLASPDKITCSYKGREGIVIKTLTERFESELNGRMILKSVSADYLDRKGAVDNA